MYTRDGAPHLYVCRPRRMTTLKSMTARRTKTARRRKTGRRKTERSSWRTGSTGVLSPPVLVRQVIFNPLGKVIFYLSTLSMTAAWSP